jgi:hypothetical protein
MTFSLVKRLYLTVDKSGLGNYWTSDNVYLVEEEFTILVYVKSAQHVADIHQVS